MKRELCRTDARAVPLWLWIRNGKSSSDLRAQGSLEPSIACCCPQALQPHLTLSISHLSGAVDHICLGAKTQRERNSRFGVRTSSAKSRASLQRTAFVDPSEHDTYYCNPKGNMFHVKPCSHSCSLHRICSLRGTTVAVWADDHSARPGPAPAGPPFMVGLGSTVGRHASLLRPVAIWGLSRVPPVVVQRGSCAVFHVKPGVQIRLLQGRSAGGAVSSLECEGAATSDSV